MNILNFPDEILAKILEYLDLQECIYLTQTCLKFRNIIMYNSNGYTWQGIIIKVIQKKILEQEYYSIFDIAADILDIPKSYYVKKNYYKEIMSKNKFTTKEIHFMIWCFIPYKHGGDTFDFFEKKTNMVLNYNTNSTKDLSKINTLLKYFFFYYLLSLSNKKFLKMYCIYPNTNAFMASRTINKLLKANKLCFEINYYQFKIFFSKKISYVKNMCKEINFKFCLKAVDFLVRSNRSELIKIILDNPFYGKNNNQSSGKYYIILKTIYQRGSVKLINQLSEYKINVQDVLQFADFSGNRMNALEKIYGPFDFNFVIQHKNILFTTVYNDYYNFIKRIKFTANEVSTIITRPVNYGHLNLHIVDYFFRKYTFDNTFVKDTIAKLIRGTHSSKFSHLFNIISFIFSTYPLDKDFISLQLGKFVCRSLFLDKIKLSYLILNLLQKNKFNTEYFEIIYEKYKLNTKKDIFINILNYINLNEISYTTKISILLDLNISTEDIHKLLNEKINNIIKNN